jgi:hypothetical protein
MTTDHRWLRAMGRSATVLVMVAVVTTIAGGPDWSSLVWVGIGLTVSDLWTAAREKRKTESR